MKETKKKTGSVYLVGAGPGDPGLLTLRGAELLRKAEVVIYDGLVNRDLLKLAPAEADFIYGGKHDLDKARSQEDLNKLLISKAQEGKRVVRLKGGDPYVFGRGGEEAEELVNAHIPFEVVPGISSAEAVPNYAGIPLTHRALASSFTVITGHEDPAKSETAMDWEHLAKTPGTLVILMSVRRIREIADSLIRHGRAADTPVSMIRWGTTGRQKAIQGTLADIADVAEKTNFLPPALTIVGDVVRMREKLNWFEQRPLFGQRIVVTRALQQAGQLSSLLLERGADVLEIPVIRFGPPSQAKPLQEALAGLNSYDWIVFTSANGVSFFFEEFLRKFDDMRDIGGVRIAAVGPATAARIREYHLHVDAIPAEAIGSQIIEEIEKHSSIENLRLLLLRAEVANKDLPDLLEEKGAIVDDIPCYRTLPESRDLNEASARLRESGADWITFTSGSTVAQFHARFNLADLLQRFPALRFASIGPETSKALIQIGLPPHLEANPHTMEGLVHALEEATEALKRESR